MKKIINQIILIALVPSTLFAYDWKSSNQQDIENYLAKLNRTIHLASKISQVTQKSNLRSYDLTQLQLLIKENTEAYQKLDRHAMYEDDLYELQFNLRYYNAQLYKQLMQVKDNHILSKVDIQSLFYEAQILDFDSQKIYKSPQKKLPIYGVQKSDWPLSAWEDDVEMYKYQFDEQGQLLYRNMKLQSGDVILNHPIEHPVGIFTATAQEQSVFAHAAMIVFLKRVHGILPVVVDVYEKGVRAVPLHLFFSSQVIGYGEVYRLQNKPQGFNEILDLQISEVLNTEFGYDLTGSSSHKKSLSCTEFISYVLELVKLNPLESKSQIQEDIYHNILKLGYMNQKFNLPNDVFQDSRFEFVGFVDNLISVQEMVVNEILLSKFRHNMMYKNLNPDKYRPLLWLGGMAIDMARYPFSPLGNLILVFTGFERDNFPVGAKNILVTVEIINTVFEKAMARCLNPETKSRKSHLPSCYLGTKSYLDKVGQEESLKKPAELSIHDVLTNKDLSTLFNLELKQYRFLFD